MTTAEVPFKIPMNINLIKKIDCAAGDTTPIGQLSILEASLLPEKTKNKSTNTIIMAKGN